MERSTEQQITLARRAIAPFQGDIGKMRALQRAFTIDELRILKITLEASGDQELGRHVSKAYMESDQRPRAAAAAAAVNPLYGEDLVPQRPQIPQRPRAAAAAAAAVVDPLDGADIVIDDNVNVSVEMLRCPICFVNVKDIKLTCGHMLCKYCANNYRTRNITTCPLCRQDITSMDKVYYKKYLKYKNKYLQLKN
jgi:hypothetical protein